MLRSSLLVALFVLTLLLAQHTSSIEARAKHHKWSPEDEDPPAKAAGPSFNDLSHQLETAQAPAKRLAAISAEVKQQLPILANPAAAEALARKQIHEQKQAAKKGDLGRVLRELGVHPEQELAHVESEREEKLHRDTATRLGVVLSHLGLHPNQIGKIQLSPQEKEVTDFLKPKPKKQAKPAVPLAQQPPANVHPTPKQRRKAFIKKAKLSYYFKKAGLESRYKLLKAQLKGIKLEAFKKLLATIPQSEEDKLQRVLDSEPTSWPKVFGAAERVAKARQSKIKFYFKQAALMDRYAKIKANLKGIRLKPFEGLLKSFPKAEQDKLDAALKKFKTTWPLIFNNYRKRQIKRQIKTALKAGNQKAVGILAAKLKRVNIRGKVLKAHAAPPKPAAPLFPSGLAARIKQQAVKAAAKAKAEAGKPRALTRDEEWLAFRGEFMKQYPAAKLQAKKDQFVKGIVAVKGLNDKREKSSVPKAQRALYSTFTKYAGLSPAEFKSRLLGAVPRPQGSGKTTPLPKPFNDFKSQVPSPHRSLDWHFGVSIKLKRSKLKKLANRKLIIDFKRRLRHEPHDEKQVAASNARLDKAAPAVANETLPWNSIVLPPVAPAPSTDTDGGLIDWRAFDVLTPVKNQGKCSAGWAHAAIETVESALARTTGVLRRLSVQHVLQCGSPNACNGGSVDGALEFIADKGVLSHRALRYTARRNGTVARCPATPPATEKVVAGWNFATAPCFAKNCDKQNEAELARVLRWYPVAVMIDGSFLQYYAGGIIDKTSGCQNGWSNLNHAVQLVGLGEEKGQKYWILRNSWGKSWGEGGFFRVAYGGNTCGVATYATQVILPDQTGK